MQSHFSASVYNFVSKDGLSKPNRCSSLESTVASTDGLGLCIFRAAGAIFRNKSIGQFFLVILGVAQLGSITCFGIKTTLKEEKDPGGRVRKTLFKGFDAFGWWVRG